MKVINNSSTHTYQTKFFKTVAQGAIVRAVCSLIMWLFALLAFWVDTIRASHLIGISYAVLYLILIGPPTLFILNRIKSRSVYVNFAIFINLLEVIGYTAVIYSAGGLEAAYLTPIYAALITYLGIMGARKVPFIIAGFCALSFGFVVVMEGFGIIPSFRVDPHFNPSVEDQVIKFLVIFSLLIIIAYISSYTAGMVRKGRNRLRHQNEELEAKKLKLEDSQRELKEAHKGLVEMVGELEREITERKTVEDGLKNALEDIQTLSGLLPICANCKKIRDDTGYWNHLESYIEEHSDAQFSHGICEDCANKLYGDTKWYKKRRNGKRDI